MTTSALPPAANAEHLTAALRKAGGLGEGSVGAIVVESSRDTLVSHIIRLSLIYEGPATDAPASVILKIAHRDWADRLWIAGRHESAFYKQLAPSMPAGLVPGCFEASWNDETRAWHLLLEDLSDTH